MHVIITDSNDFLFGSASTFLQKFALVKPIELQWIVHRAERGITARSLPATGPNSYDALWFKWISERWGEFGTWSLFDSSKATFRGFLRTGVWNDTVADASLHCNFLNPHLNNDAIIHAWHKVYTTMTKVEGTIEIRIWRILVTVLLRLTYPSPDGSPYPWAIEGGSKVVDTLLEDMVDSAVYKNADKQNKVTAEDDRKDGEEGRVKRRKKAAPKSLGKIEAEDVMSVWVEESPGKWRHIYCIEDAAKMLSSVLSKVKEDKWCIDQVELVVLTLYKYILVKETTFGGKHYKLPPGGDGCYNALRNALKGHLSRVHNVEAIAEASDVLSVISTENSAEMAEELEVEVGDALHNGTLELLTSLGKPDFVFGVTKCLVSNGMKVFETASPTSAAGSDANLEEPKKVPSEVTIKEKVRINIGMADNVRSQIERYYDALNDELPHASVQALYKLASYRTEAGQLPTVVAGIIDSAGELERLLKKRCELMLATLIDGNSGLCLKVKNWLAKADDATKPLLSSYDLEMDTREQWVSMWAFLVQPLPQDVQLKAATPLWSRLEAISLLRGCLEARRGKNPTVQ